MTIQLPEEQELKPRGPARGGWPWWRRAPEPLPPLDVNGALAVVPLTGMRG